MTSFVANVVFFLYLARPYKFQLVWLCQWHEISAPNKTWLHFFWLNSWIVTFCIHIVQIHIFRSSLRHDKYKTPSIDYWFLYVRRQISMNKPWISFSRYLWLQLIYWLLWSTYFRRSSDNEWQRLKPQRIEGDKNGR